MEAMTMHLIRYQPEYKEPMLALHHSAIEGFVLGISQQQDEADLMSVEEVYLHSSTRRAPWELRSQVAGSEPRARSLS